MRTPRLRARREKKRASSPVRVVVGLGNPGAGYAGDRHNVGRVVICRLVGRAGSKLGRAPSRVRGLAAQVGAGEDRTLYFVPGTFMNESGGAVSAALAYYRVSSEDMLVIHDDIDLPLGRLRLRVGGGSGGHNGVRSVEKALGDRGFSRLKVGVGRPPGAMSPADHVLRPFTRKERPEVAVIVEDAADVVELWCVDPDRAQERAALRGKDA